MVQIHVIGSQLTEIILLLQRSIQLGTALPVLPAVCHPSHMLYGSCHCWLVVVMVPLLLVCVSPSWAVPLWVGCYQVVLLCIERTCQGLAGPWYARRECESVDAMISEFNGSVV